MKLTAEQVEIFAQSPRQVTLEEVADLCDDWYQHANYIEQLEDRLEVWAMTDAGERIRVGSDGIACRDETIRQQDKLIEQLQALVMKLEGGGMP
jgi:hypothetical protein